MRFPVCRILIASIAVIFFLSVPALADEMIPTVTHVFFEKNGLPYNESVYFTVRCYGYRCSGWDCRPPPDGFNESGTPAPEMVFSFSATCPGYGCTIYEPYYLNYRHIDRCNLAGETGGGNFSIPDFSSTPVPDCQELMPYMIGKANNQYYNTTPEYEQCLNGTYRQSELCDQYVTECSPVTDKDCGNWIIDGRYVKDSDRSLVCREEADRTRDACDIYLKKVDPPTMIMWKDTNGREEAARRTCELRFTIPLSPSSLNETPAGLPSKKSYGSPIMNGLCTVLRFFGRECE